jgi:LuxR family transcriptional regulator, activator of conjugal transfer of Ti plasmids
MFFEDASAFGIRSGLSVPVTVGFGNTAVLTLASDDRAFASGLVVDPIAAAAAVGQIHMRLDAIATGARPHRPVRMTARELRCLRWSAEGKSMRTIAALENTTYANVCYFLRNAKQALNAQTLAQATKIATQLRLL